ncbi:uncharacterized protein F5147DRAFT_583652, partial [Suillus discolor]
ILIVGRGNAGKTTILQRVCNTQDDPEIHNKVSCILSGRHELMYSQRGLHDIENEIVFRSNPSFVFHDSCGFESGSKDEFEKVKAFITDHSKKTKITNQLHAIW